MKPSSSKQSWLLILITVFLANSQIANAEDAKSVTDNYCDRFSDLELVAENPDQSQQKEVITEQSPALSGVVLPSLWWAREQFDPFDGRLIDNWLENHQLKQIDLVAMH